MIKASSPQYRRESASHSDPHCLLQSFESKNDLVTFEYSVFGEGDKAHFRVDKLTLPVGQNDAFIPVYQMHYQPAIAGKREGKTTVKNNDGTSTIYHFSQNLLMTSIQYLGSEGSLKKEKIFTWSDKNWLLAVELRGENKQLLLRKSYEYDDFGNPVTEIFTGDLQGNGEEDSYRIKREFSQDGRNLLKKEEIEEGKITLFEYLPNTNLVTLKLVKDGDHLLIRESFLYDDCHNLIRKSIEDGKGQKRITDYILRQNQPFLHMPEWIEEKYLENGNEKFLKRICLKYDALGNVAEEKNYDANGAYSFSIFKEYNERGDIISETNALGQKRTFAYDEKGRRVESTNFSQKLKEEMRYDAKGRLVEHKEIGTDEAHTTSYVYNDNDDLIQKIDTYGNSYAYSYDPLTHKITRSDSPPVITHDGQSLNVATFSTYDVLGREVSKTDANGYTIMYRYNAYGLPVEITYPNGSQEFFRYTKGGKIASYTNRDGLKMIYSFDVLGRLISKNYKDFGKESYSYDSFNLLEEIDLDGHATHYAYDGAKRKIQEEKCGRITEYAYDALGYLEKISKDSQITLFKRDLEGRILEEKKTDREGKLLYKISYRYTDDGDLAGTTRYINGKEATESFTYDAFGREIEHQDPYGDKVSTRYNENYTNSLGQKVLQIKTVDPKRITKTTIHDPYFKVVQEETINPQGTTIACWNKIYDPNGNVLYWKEHVYEDGAYQNTQCTHFTYTSGNQISSATRAFGTPDSRTAHYTYTPGGKVAIKTLPDGISLSYAYDALGFLRRLSSSDGQILHRFECTKKGELIRTIDEREKISVQREIDAFGNVIRELFPNNIEIKKSYDFQNRLTSLQMAHLGAIAYVSDPLYLRSVSRLSAEGKVQYTHQYEDYDLDGNLLSESMILNAGKIKHVTDKKGRKTKITSPYFSQTCLYEACNNLIESTIDQTYISYGYDDLSQLISENESSYGYDSLFNRKEKDHTTFKTNHLNELIDQTYDLNGNQTQNGDTQYVYDPLNRLREATIANHKVRFIYDPLGRCLSKIVLRKSSKGWQETSREHYLYNGVHEIGAITSDGSLKNLRVLGYNMREEQPETVAIELKNQIFAPIMDVQGNICRLINPSTKKIVSKYEFTSFGEETRAQNDENPWRFAAKRFDPELNLIYYGKRFYNPELARWLTTDPAGFADSLNLYQYAFNNPYSYYDPNGEFLLFFSIPFTLFFTPAAVKICIDAIAIGLGSFGLYKGMQCAADAAGSPYAPSEEACHFFVNTVADNGREHEYTKTDRKKKRDREKNYPGDPKDLEKNHDWGDTTHPGEAKSGRRVFENTKTGEVIEYDKGRPGEHGHKARDHYHRRNPNSKGNGDEYLDKDGKPCGKGSEASHLYPPEGTSWS